MRLPTLLTDFAYETARLVRYPAGDQCEIMRVQSSKVTAANSQGRRMLQNDRENLELERLENESRKLIV
jgi:hypothetical protein